MTPYYADEDVILHHGDCLDVLAAMPDSSVDAVVTDPPYGLEFMGKDWDKPWAQHFTGIREGSPLPDRQLHVNPRCLLCGGYRRGTRRPCRCHNPEWNDSQVAAVARTNAAFGEWCHDWAVECLRVLKPGGHLLAFGGTRTYHRLVCAIEDAGFEIRDTIAWLYGSGFPKSLDVSKAIDKAAGAEREVIGRSSRAIGPSQERGYQGSATFREAGWEDGNLVTAPATEDAKRWDGWGTALKPAHEPIVVARKPLASTVAQNVLTHGTGALNIDATRVAHASDADLAASKAKNPGRSDLVTSDTYGAGRPQQSVNDAGRWPTNVVLDEAAAAELDRQSGTVRSAGLYHKGARGVGSKDGPASIPIDGLTSASYDDAGGASRFFPIFRYEAKANAAERPRAGEVAHPTVKPLDLMRWLVRLVTPPGGLVLDPFSGSGTTAEACVIEGFRCIAIEREAEYLPLIVARLSKPLQPVLLEPTNPPDSLSVA